MKDESILMSKINIDGKDFYFGHLLFAMEYIGKIKHSHFKKIDEQLEFLRYVSLTLSAITPHKQQRNSCQNLWNYINKERKRDSRITKEILKEWPKELGDNIFHYYERKERKFVPKKNMKIPKGYLLSLCSLLKFFKYKMSEDEYLKIRADIYVSILERFKDNSEYGLGPVIKQKSIGLIKDFYPYYPEIINLPYSEQCPSKNLFKVLIDLWNISGDIKFLKSLDLNFEILKNSENASVVSHIYENIIKIIKEKPELEVYVPKIVGFKKIQANIYFEEINVYQLKIDVQVLQKIMLESNISINKITPEICESNLKILMSYELENLNLIRPLRKLYISKDKRAIEFIFTRNEIDNIELFTEYWKKVVSELILSESTNDQVYLLEVINEEYEMKKQVKKTSVKYKVHKY